jgi:hypothetical protein
MNKEEFILKQHNKQEAGRARRFEKLFRKQFLRITFCKLPTKKISLKRCFNLFLDKLNIIVITCLITCMIPG